MANQLPGSFLRRQAASLADEEMFEEVVGHVDLSQAALEAYYASNTAELTQVCLNVIVADTPGRRPGGPRPDRRRGQLRHGGHLRPTPTRPGPRAGASCSAPTRPPCNWGRPPPPPSRRWPRASWPHLSTLVRQGSTGATTTFYLVVQMRARQLVPFATLRNSIRQVILEAHVSVVGTTLNKLVGEAHVTVDPRYGTWSARRGVTVPTAPPPAFVLNAAANVPPPSTGLGLPGLTIEPAPG